MFRVRLVSLGLLAASAAGAAPLSPEQADFFEKQVRPVLANRCYECHSAEKKQKGGLALDTRASTLKGGDTGPALAAGDPEKSLLIEAVRYGNHDLQMPPKKRLSEGEVKTLEEWVKMGAPDPREAAPVVKAGRVIDIEAGRKFWSFTPLARVTPPAEPAAASPIDRFIQAKLREQGPRACAAGGQTHAAAPRDLRPDRPAADAGGDGRVCRGRGAGCVRARDRAAARLAAIWRALGPALARRGALCRLERPR